MARWERDKNLGDKHRLVYTIAWLFAWSREFAVLSQFSIHVGESRRLDLAKVALGRFFQASPTFS